MLFQVIKSNQLDFYMTLIKFKFLEDKKGLLCKGLTLSRALQNIDYADFLAQLICYIGTL